LLLRAVFFVLRFAVFFRAAFFPAPLFRAALFRAALLRAAFRPVPVRLRAVLLVLRAAADLRPALLLRLPLLFFWARAIVLLRSHGSYTRSRAVMTKKQNHRTTVGRVPPERGLSQRPPLRGIALTPKGEPLAQPRPPERVAAAPRERGVGAVPNPRKPQLVRDVHGNELMDLFDVFPDLPRPPRTVARIPARRSRRY
jgi:hypothetical protein